MVDFAHDVVGMNLFPWQRWLFIHGLELRAPGWFRFRTVLVLVARQNGKTLWLELKNLWKLFVLRVPMVIGTAQILDYAEESWDKAVEIIEGTPELAEELAHVDKTNGKKQLKLKGGSRWKIAAASRRGGRSLTGDDVNLDELREHQNWESWAAVTKTTIARPKAQVWGYSNAGDDKSVVLNSLLETGRATVGDPWANPTFGLFEWSVPDDACCDCARVQTSPHATSCRLADRKLWVMANPSLGYGTITEESLLSALNTDPEAVFRTEDLCQRVRTMARTWRVLKQPDWLDAEDLTTPARQGLSLSLYQSPESTHAAICAAWWREDGDVLVAVFDHRAGVGWSLGRTVELAAKWKPCRVVVDTAGTVGAIAAELAEELRKIDVELVAMKLADVTSAFGIFRNGIAKEPDPDQPPDPVDSIDVVVDDAVTAPSSEPARVRKLWVRTHSLLNLAVADATTRWVRGSKAWEWRSETDMSTLLAATQAVWGLVTAPAGEPEAMPLVAWR